jgi:Ni,Fe-hydrogenase I large subunit
MAFNPNYPSTPTNEVDPISRIEGHLGVAVTVDTNVVTNAFAHGNLWRGFENFLLGREVNDAITFVQRICGVCPVPHGMTSTYAVDTVLGYSQGHITFADDGTWGVPKKAVSIRNLVLGAEFLMSSITHFYHLAAPSYIQGPAIPPWTPYFDDSYYADLGDGLHNTGTNVSMRSYGAVAPGIDGTDGFTDGVWSTVIRSYVLALRVRRLTFEAAALFAGRMPMTSTYVGGGVTFDGTENLTDRANMYKNIMVEIGHFVVEEYVPIALALSVLYPTYDNTHNAGGTGIGSGLKRYVAWGAFPASDVTSDSAALALPGGYKDLNGGGGDFVVTNKGDVRDVMIPAVKANLTEDIANSRYEVDTAHDATAYGANTYAYPGDVSRTKPKRSHGYTYMKAPRWNQKSCEVGPLARLMVAGLVKDNVAYADNTPVTGSGVAPYYLAYVKTASGNTGLNPAMISADIAVALFRAGLATVRNATVANALDPTHTTIPLDHDFTYAEVYANRAAIAGLLGTSGVHATLAAAYMNADTVITGAIETHIVGLKGGASTMDRLRARAFESLYLVQQILGTYTPTSGTWTGQSDRGSFAGGGWIDKLLAQTGLGQDTSTSTWKPKALPTGGAQGWGGTEAPRGALMHQVTIDGSCKITKYQCIVPTTWNGSPVIGDDSDKLNHGAIEAACIGAPFAAVSHNFAIQGLTGTHTAVDGVEVLRCAESFDPCIACAVH